MKTRTIRIAEETAREILALMKLKGIDCTLPQAVDILLSIASFHSTEAVELRAQRVGSALSRLSQHLRDKVMSYLKERSFKLPELESDFLRVAEELQPKIEAPSKDELRRIGSSESTRQIPLPKKPPWEALPRMGVEQIQVKYRRHPLLKFAKKSQTARLAVECAFGVSPSEIHKSKEIEEIVFRLYEEFERYNKRKEEEDGRHKET